MKTALRSAVSALALLTVASAATAADLPAYEAAPLVAVPSFSWTGFYIGVNAGYTWGDRDFRTRGNETPTINNVNLGLRPARIGLDGDGFIVGATIGYNVQLDNSPLVFGIEADLSYTDVDDSKTFNAVGPAIGGPPAVPGNIRSVFKQELEYLGTVRGRIGYAFDRVLVFGTGGLAFGKVKTSADFFNNAGGGAGGLLGFEGDRNKTEYGFVVGGGAEYAVTDNITIKGEYLYYDLGSSTLRVNRTANGPLPTVANPILQTGYKSRTETDGHIVRAGINYKF